MSKYKIIHIVTDEKFIDGAIELFESFDDFESEYVILNEKIQNYKYIKSNKVHSVSIEWLKNTCIYSKKYDIVIIHGLMGNDPNIIYRINKNIKVIWFSWGYDLYEMPLPINPLISLKNQIRGVNQIKYNIILILKKLVRFTKETIKYHYHNIRIWNKALNRIDFYSGVFPEEFKLLKNNKSFRALEIQYNYTSKSSPIKYGNINIITHSNRKNIMVGHQANQLLNHIECFKMLKKMKISEDYNIICPLSYGSKKDIDKVCCNGYRIFGKNFKPLLDFLPLNDYIKIYNSINVAIYDIQRQCAIGNILMLIWEGVKVFLPKESMNYIHFKNLGIKVYSIEEELNIDNIINNESSEVIMSNRRILLKHYSYDSIKDKLIKSLSEITETRNSVDVPNYNIN